MVWNELPAYRMNNSFQVKFVLFIFFSLTRMLFQSKVQRTQVQTRKICSGERFVADISAMWQESEPFLNKLSLFNVSLNLN